jgi:alpha-1,2-mannosyltransferase
VVFYAIKMVLGLISAYTEWRLYRAIDKRVSPAIARTFLLLLCVSSGLFAASTSLLPSTFTMYWLTFAAAFIMESKLALVILTSVVGEFGAVSFLPFFYLSFHISIYIYTYTS